jgi:hypothetical protein
MCPLCGAYVFYVFKFTQSFPRASKVSLASYHKNILCNLKQKTSLIEEAEEITGYWMLDR